LRWRWRGPSGRSRSSPPAPTIADEGQRGHRRGSFSSVTLPKEKILPFADHYKPGAHPFLWTATADSSVEPNSFPRPPVPARLSTAEMQALVAAHTLSIRQLFVLLILAALNVPIVMRWPAVTQQP